MKKGHTIVGTIIALIALALTVTSYLQMHPLLPWAFYGFFPILVGFSMRSFLKQLEMDVYVVALVLLGMLFGAMWYVLKSEILLESLEVLLWFPLFLLPSLIRRKPRINVEYEVISDE